MASSGSALVMLNDRPAPRCKRRRYRCAVHAQPIRISTVRYACTYFLRVSRTRGRKIRPGRGCEFVARSCVHPLARPRSFAPASLRAQRSIPSCNE